MDPNTQALMMGAAGAGGAAETLYVEDVFSTWLYDGNGSTQTITNGIDLSTKGGLVWIKARSTNLGENVLNDTARGAGYYLYSNVTNGQSSTAIPGFQSFNNNGFTIKEDAADTPYVNANARAYASWTFRKAAKFFDVVTYTGNGSNRTISHSLGSVPGAIWIKRLDTTGDWQVYHRSLANTEYLVLNSNAAKATGTTRWNSTTPTSTVFSLGTDTSVNANGGTYVAYLFAHETTASDIIQCGTFTRTVDNQLVELGWEPQWVMWKDTASAGQWFILDTARGWTAGGDDSYLQPSAASAEASADYGRVTPTGFEVNNFGFNSKHIYIAIRRGPMKTPTDATKVFQPKVYTGTNVDNRLVTTDIVTDMVWVRQRDSTTVSGMVVGDRMRGQPYILTGDNSNEFTDADSFDQQLVSAVEYGTAFSSMTGFWVGNDVNVKLNADTTSNNHVVEAFRRAPGFFDVVAYTGTGAVLTVNHNLGVAPELMIVKQRNSTGNWTVYTSISGPTKIQRLNADIAATTIDSTYWNNTAPTSSVFTVGSISQVNAGGSTYLAYLFASCTGVSKIGSYTGTGTTLQINCGFTAGARLVLIKRSDSTGDWYIWDTARGIAAGNDPYLLLNSTAAEATATDYIDPLNSGFEISSTAPAAINANGGTFIYLAIA